MVVTHTDGCRRERSFSAADEDPSIDSVRRCAYISARTASGRATQLCDATEVVP